MIDRARGKPLASLALGLLVATAAAGARAQDGGPATVGDGGPTAVAADGGDGGAADGGDDGGDGGAAPAKAPPRPLPADRVPRVSARLGAERVELGQRIPLVIEVTPAQPGDRVHLREARRFGPFELLDRSRSEGTGGGAGPAERLELELITFEVGHLEVPPIELMVVLPDGRTGSVSTPALQIEVTDPLGNEPDPQARSDHDPRPVMTTDRRALWFGGILGAMLLAALGGAVVGRLRERRRPRPAPPPPPPRPPEEVALEKLDEIKRGKLLEEGEVQAFHVAVSEAIREYLGGRYGFDSLELTTEELMANLELVTLRGVTRSEVELFLSETDLVKFAKWRPSDERSRELLGQAYDLVKRSTKAEEAYEVRSSIKASGERGGSDEPTR